jgi:hypothetical protein
MNGVLHKIIGMIAGVATPVNEKLALLETGLRPSKNVCLWL